MIPVVIVPTILKRPDLLERMLASIDHPVHRLVFVVNDLSDWTWTGSNPLIGEVHYIRPALGLGNHGGINAGITQTPGAPWWLFVTDDIAFGPGDLDEIVAMIEDGDEPCVVTGSYEAPKLLSFCYGAINRACVERVGLVDEWTFYPIYFGDNDYHYRCKLAGVEWVVYDGDMRHGDDDTTSATLKAEPHFQARNAETFEWNRRAYIDKWGGGVGGEQYTTPWNLPVPQSYTQVDLRARAARIW